VQGPRAVELGSACLPAALAAAVPKLRTFACVAEGDTFVARTGYTGEDGFEVVLPAAGSVALWQALVAAGAAACGLGARDTLRLEAALPLYGQDMDAGTSPLEAALGWTVAFEPANRA